MKKLAKVIFCLGLGACGSEGDKIKVQDPLDTGSLSTEAFSKKSLSLVDPDMACNDLNDFFSSYTAQYLSGVTVSIECAEIEGPIYSADEMKSMSLERQLECKSIQRCFKSTIAMKQGDVSDKYFAMLVLFNDGGKSGLVRNASKANKHYLPRKGDVVYSGQLLHDNLSHLYSTFSDWVYK